MKELKADKAAQELAKLAADWKEEDRQRLRQAAWLRVRNGVTVTPAKPHPSSWSHQDLLPTAGTLLSDLGIPAATAANILQGLELSAVRGGSQGHFHMLMKCATVKHKSQVLAAKSKIAANNNGVAPAVWHSLTTAQSKYYSAHLHQNYVAALQQARAGGQRGPGAHIDWRTMVLTVGGQALNFPDSEQAKQRMLPPGSTWSNDDAPTTR